MRTQKDLCTALIQILNIIDFINDGKHTNDIDSLMGIMDELVEQLNDVNLTKFASYVDKRYAE